jgi:hypothetical protein
MLFQADGYCIDTLCGMFSYIEKPFTLVDIIADEVVVISDGVSDDCTLPDDKPATIATLRHIKTKNFVF